MKNKIDLVSQVRNLVRFRYPIKQATPSPGRRRSWMPRVNILMPMLNYPHGNPLFQSLFGAFLAFMFYYFFNSMFLALLCLAFFVFIPEQTSVRATPSPSPGPNSIRTLNKWFFILAMLALLFMAFINAPLLGIGLELNGTINPTNWNSSTVIFIAVWIISFFSGLGRMENRQAIGVIMVIVCFVIFTIGIGTQSVGKAAFGSWWPTVYKFGSNIFGPLFDSLGQFMGTMGRGFELITNPVGVANRIASGNYAGDPTTGSKGALGLKIDSVKVTPIFPHQPFEISVKLKNEGSVDAENVQVGLEIGEEGPAEFDSIVITNPYKLVKDVGFIEAVKKTVDLSQDFLTIKGMGFDNGTQKVGDPPGHIEKKNTDEVFFRTSPEGTPCEVIASYQVRSQYIPITAFVNYDYSIQSNLPLEIVSKEEWARRVVEGIGENQRKVSASLSNAPIKLNVDGPEQPIREGRPIFIGLSLESAQKRGEIESVDRIKLSYPQELKFSKCTLTPTSTDAGQITWEKVTKTSVIFCDFVLDKPLTEPVQSYLIRAEANFTFKSIKSVVATMEFGGGCCYDSSISTTLRNAECPTGTTCDWKPGQGSPGKCIPSTGTGTAASLPAKYTNVDMDYCSKTFSNGQICDLGEGHCNSDNKCEQNAKYGVKWPDPGQLDQVYRLTCRKLSTVPEFNANGFSVCCPEAASTDQCVAAYKSWVDGKQVSAANSRLTDLKDAYKGTT